MMTPIYDPERPSFVQIVMSEMTPYEKECAERIIELINPEDPARLIGWRQDCIGYHLGLEFVGELKKREADVQTF